MARPRTDPGGGRPRPTPVGRAAHTALRGSAARLPGPVRGRSAADGRCDVGRDPQPGGDRLRAVQRGVRGRLRHRGPSGAPTGAALPRGELPQRPEPRRRARPHPSSRATRTGRAPPAQRHGGRHVGARRSSPGVGTPSGPARCPARPQRHRRRPRGGPGGRGRRRPRRPARRAGRSGRGAVGAGAADRRRPRQLGPGVVRSRRRARGAGPSGPVAVGRHPRPRAPRGGPRRRPRTGTGVGVAALAPPPRERRRSGDRPVGAGRGGAVGSPGRHAGGSVAPGRSGSRPR